MSKAFTREDDADEAPVPAPRWPKVPPGAKNYVTPSGAGALRAELDQLLHQERPTLAALPTDDSRRELQLLDQRLLHLQQSLESPVIVEPAPPPWNQVRFGATVRVRDRDGEQSTDRIVGVDEADLDRDGISGCSRLARALVNSQRGKRIRFRVPAGKQELEIGEISYD